MTGAFRVQISLPTMVMPCLKAASREKFRMMTHDREEVYVQNVDIRWQM